MEKVIVNNIDISSRVTSMEYYDEMDKDLLIGSAVSTQVKLKIRNNDRLLDNQLDYLFKIGDKSYVVFEKPEKWTELLNLTLYDLMILSNVPYQTKLSYPTTVEKQLDEMGTMMRVTIDKTTLSADVLNKNVDWYDNTMIIRNYLGFIAQADGKNCFIEKDKVVFKRIAGNKHQLDFCSDFKINELLTFSRVCYDNGLEILSAGTESGKTMYVSPNNDYIEQSDINRIYQMYNGLSFYSFKKFNTKDNGSINLTDLMTYHELILMPLSIKCKVYGGEAKNALNMSGDISIKNVDSVVVKNNPTIKIKRIQTIVDKNKQTLEILAQDIKDGLGRITQLELSVDEIKMSVKNTEEKVEEVRLKPTITINTLFPEQQVYSPKSNTFTPDWSKQHQVLTPEVRVMGIVQTLEPSKLYWSKKNGVLGANEVISDGILTISENLLKSEKTATYVVTYDYEQDKSVSADVSFSLVQDGKDGEGVDGKDAYSCSISATGSSFVSQDGTTYEPKQITLTPQFQNCGFDLWQYSSDGLNWKNVVSEKDGFTINTDNSLTLSNDTPLLSDYQKSLNIKLLSNQLDVVSTYTILKLKDGSKGDKGDKGQDAITLHILSSNGSIFKNSSLSTTLSVTIVVGGASICSSREMYEIFGENAKIIWEQKRFGEETFTKIDSADSRLSDNGFILTLSSNDVYTQTTFTCSLDY